MTKELINKIAQYRAVNSISQQDLADAIGVSRKTISTVETSRFVPSVIIALKIAKYFQVNVEDIFSLNEH